MSRKSRCKTRTGSSSPRAPLYVSLCEGIADDPDLYRLLALAPASVSAQAPLRKIGELELAIRGLSATVEPETPVVPRNVASAVRVVVRAGALELTAAEALVALEADLLQGVELRGLLPEAEILVFDGRDTFGVRSIKKFVTKSYPHDIFTAGADGYQLFQANLTARSARQPAKIHHPTTRTSAATANHRSGLVALSFSTSWRI